MISIDVDSSRIMARLGAMPEKVRSALIGAAGVLALKLQSHIKADKLSGQVLNVRTGNLRRSIAEDVTSDATSVTGKVFSSGDVKYAAIHEYGGVIDRVGSKVGAYQIVMPERSFMRTGLADMRQDIVDELTAAVRKGAQ